VTRGAATADTETMAIATDDKRTTREDVHVIDILHRRLFVFRISRNPWIEVFAV
jgi:hypothetical protein